MLDNLVQKSLEHSAEKPGDYIKDKKQEVAVE